MDELFTIIDTENHSFNGTSFNSVKPLFCPSLVTKTKLFKVGFNHNPGICFKSFNSVGLLSELSIISFCPK